MSETKTTDQDEKSYIHPGDAARRLFVSTKTLQRMAERGSIASIILDSGHRRYLEADVEAMRTSTREGAAASTDPSQSAPALAAHG